jgi:hypothetical protein
MRARKTDVFAGPAKVLTIQFYSMAASRIMSAAVSDEIEVKWILKAQVMPAMWLITLA